MPKTKYSKEYLKNHFFYSRWVYLVLVLVALGAAEITFTVTRYQAPNARRVDIELLGGYADLSNTADAEKALLAAGQAYERSRDEANGVDTSASSYEVPLQEVGIYTINYSGTVSDNDDYYAGQKYMVMLAAQEGDIYIVTREMLESLVDDCGIAPLDPFIESGLLSTEGVDLDDVTFDEAPYNEGDEPSGNRYVYALPADSLVGLARNYSYPVSGRYIVIMAYSQNQDTAAAVVRELFTLYGVSGERITGVVLASVVPQLTPTLIDALARIAGSRHKLLSLSSGIKTGLNIRSDQPQQVGADRVAAAVAAKARGSLPCVVVDCGCATTFTVLDENGALVASAITAGVELSLEALRAQTAQLPTVALVRGARYDVMARNTADAMRVGAVMGAAAMVDGLIGRYAAVLGKTPRVWLTGDCCQLITPHLSIGWDRADDLIFEGLRLVWSKNRG